MRQTSVDDIVIVGVFPVQSPEGNPKNSLSAAAGVAKRMKESDDFGLTRQTISTSIASVPMSDIKLEDQIETNK